MSLSAINSAVVAQTTTQQASTKDSNPADEAGTTTQASNASDATQAGRGHGELGTTRGTGAETGSKQAATGEREMRAAMKALKAEQKQQLHALREEQSAELKGVKGDARDDLRSEHKAERAELKKEHKAERKALKEGGSTPGAEAAGDAGATQGPSKAIAQAPGAPGTKVTESTGPVTAVSDAAGLTAALANAKPGDIIELADGTYEGNFVIDKKGTPEAPITLRGSRNVVLGNGPTDKAGYSLHLNGADHWRLDGFSVKGGQKGVMADATTGTVLRNMDVGNTGHEAVHFRSGSTNNLIENNNIHDTGLDKPDYGEGVYLGQAHSNWKGGVEDTSDHNSVIGNTISNTTAENIDIKEGTKGGVIRGNTLDGSGITGANYADSLIDVKGTEYVIEGNTGVGGSPNLVNGFETHVMPKGEKSGAGNTFTNNDLSALKLAGGAGIVADNKGAVNTVDPVSNKMPG